MNRIVRIELRRSAALGLGVAMVLLGATVVLLARSGWAGRWMALTMLHRQTLVALWPLALAGGAWQARRERRCRVEELLTTVARPRWQRSVATAAALAGVMAAAFVLPFLAAAAWLAPTAGYYPAATPAIVAVGALSLVAAVWLGAAIGRALPYLVTAPALVVAGYLAVMGLPAGYPAATGGLYRFLLLASPVAPMEACCLMSIGPRRPLRCLIQKGPCDRRG